MFEKQSINKRTEQKTIIKEKCLINNQEARELIEK
jgi:hypothetical protein